MVTNRRNFLKTVGAGSLGISGIGSVVAGGSKNIVIHRAGSRTITKTVPNSWYKYEQKVDTALQNARKKYGAVSGILSIHIIPADINRGGMRANQIEIGIQKSSGITESSLPDSVEGIPVQVKSIGTPRLTAGCHYGGEYDQIDGGVSIGTEADSSGNYNYGTASCRVFYNGEECLLTCNHVWNSCENNVGDKALQGREYVGDIVKASKGQDYAIIEDATSSNSYTDYIKNPGTHNQLPSGDLEVDGFFTRNGLKYLMDQALPIWKQGTTTGQEIGHIYRLDYSVSNECVNLDNGVYSSCNSADGDSGGPTYAEVDSNYGDVGMVGVHVATDELEDTGEKECDTWVYDVSVASPAYSIYNDGVTFEEDHGCC